MERFFIDEYLYNLAKDINKSETFNNITIRDYHHKFNVTYLRNELDFFNYLNLNLRNVYAKYRHKICYTHPKNIKIILGKEISGMDVSHVLRIPTCDLNVLDLNFVYFYIFINNYHNFHPEASYIHEITHTQVTKGLNQKENINGEILPMFIEFIYGNYNDKNQVLYKSKLLSDYVYLYLYTNDEAIRELTSMYIISSLKSINLYNIYKNSNLNTKKEIMKNIQQIFDYNITVEDLLNKYNISYDTFKPDVKKLIKINE